MTILVETERNYNNLKLLINTLLSRPGRFQLRKSWTEVHLIEILNLSPGKGLKAPMNLSPELSQQSGGFSELRHHRLQDPDLNPVEPRPLKSQADQTIR